jgi:hypothetical protein
LGPTAYSIAIYQNNAPEMARQVAAAACKTGEEDFLLALNADTAAYFGHLRKARELSRQASNSARRAGGNEASATYEKVAALREGLFGNTDKARKQIRVATPLPSVGDPYYGFALALAYAGNANGVQRLIEDFDKRFPEDTTVQFNYLPTLRAKLALMHSNAQQALNDFELAAPYELGLPAITFYNWPSLYPA